MRYRPEPRTPRQEQRRGESVRCEKCGSTSTMNRYVDVEEGRMLGTCSECHPTISSWGAICRRCDAPRYRHTGDRKTICPTLGSVEGTELPGLRRALPAAPQKELDIVDAEVVELPEGT